MIKTISKICLVFLALYLVSCAPATRGKMHFYHGQKVPDEFISVLSSSAQEVEFKVRVEFKETRLYHLILEGDEVLAEGWYPAVRGAENFYTVRIKAKEGVQFETGKTYRLCIGVQSPEYIAVYSSNYQCLVDYEFVLTR
jgi:hypothetical protein